MRVNLVAKYYTVHSLPDVVFERLEVVIPSSQPVWEVKQKLCWDCFQRWKE